MGRERRTHRTQPMGGAAAAPREVRLTRPGGTGEPRRLLTRALGRTRLSRRAGSTFASAVFFSPVWGSPPKPGSSTCAAWIPARPPSVRTSHLPSRPGKSPSLGSGASPPQVPDFHLSLSWPVISLPSPSPLSYFLPSGPPEAILPTPLCPAVPDLCVVGLPSGLS